MIFSTLKALKNLHNIENLTFLFHELLYCIKLYLQLQPTLWLTLSYNY